MAQTGPLNALTDVPGIAVGHAEDRDLLTGATVILPDRPAIAAVEVLGGGPGSRETEVLSPASTVQEVHGIALSGGSAFGLDAAGGAMDWLRAQGKGFDVAGQKVPIVPGAILFDLTFGDAPQPQQPPWWQLGRQAAEAAAPGAFTLGNAGAGLGARAAGLKGGVGTASCIWQGITVAALAVANPIGSVLIPGTRHFWAWPFEQAAEFGGLGPPAAMPRDLTHDFSRPPGASTTLVVIATDAALSRAQAKRLAIMGHDGMARAIRPVHTPLDGDTVFAMATGTHALADPVNGLATLGMLGADCVARAIARGVFEAQSLAGYPAWRDLPDPGN
ncbi:MAG: P1 family peptidase [Pseudomonadota bacterium]